MNKVKISFYLIKTKANASGEVPIYVRVSVNSKAEMRSTGVYCRPGQWCKKSLQVQNDSAKSMRIRSIKLTLESHLILLEASRQNFAALDLISFRQESENFTLLQIIADFLNFKKKQIGQPYGITASTFRALRNRAENIQKFMIAQNLTSIRAQDIDKRFTDKLLQHLIFNQGCTSKEFAGKHLILIKSAFKQAVIDRKLENNPVQYIPIPKDAPREVIALNQDEIKLLQLCITTLSLARVRDLFLFMCYTGLAYQDAQNINADQIYSKEGMRWIRLSRQKTGSVSLVPILPEAEKIINRYSGQLPQISNVKFNLYLKALAAQVGIEKHLTTHIARKTFACIALEKGISMDSVSAMLGHNSIKTTQRHYGKVLEGRLARELRAG